MICATAQNVAPPYDTSELYWLQPGRDSWPLYSSSAFFFASEDGSRLVPAMQDEERLVSALTTAITDFVGLDCVSGLQSVLDALTASQSVPAPRWPSVGDTGVLGIVEFVTGPIITPLVFKEHPGAPMWVGHVRAFFAQNGFDYTQPDATRVEAGSPDIGQFNFQFTNLSALTKAQTVAFDIVSGPYAPMASNLRSA
jgi:hypothetical protein